MAPTSFRNSRSSSRNAGTQSSPTLIDISSNDELHHMIGLEHLRQWNLELRELLLDSLRRNLIENIQVQTEQNMLINAVQSSRELDAEDKEYILRTLKTLKDQSATQTGN